MSVGLLASSWSLLAALTFSCPLFFSNFSNFLDFLLPLFGKYFHYNCLEERLTAIPWFQVVSSCTARKLSAFCPAGSGRSVLHMGYVF